MEILGSEFSLGPKVSRKFENKEHRLIRFRKKLISKKKINDELVEEWEIQGEWQCEPMTVGRWEPVLVGDFGKTFTSSNKF